MVHPIPGAPITAAYKKPGALWSLGWHTGTDFGAKAGTPILAPVPGKVIAANAYDKSYGYKVIIEWGDLELWLCHMPKDAATVKVGQTVTAGQRVGAVGSTGNVTGPHLHMELRIKGGKFAAATFRDPMIAVNHQPTKPAAPNAGQPLKPTVRYEITATALNGRRGPGTDYAIGATRSKGVQFTATRQSGKWVRASSLWYHTDYLKRVSATPAPTPPPALVQWYSCAFGNLKGDDSEGAKTYAKRLPAMVDDLTHGTPDIALGCEVRDGSQATALREAMKAKGYPIGYIAEGNFAFFRAGTQVGYAAPFTLPKSVQGEGRPESLLRIRAKVNGHWLHIGVSHLDFRPGPKFDALRVVQAKTGVIDAMERFGVRYDLEDLHRQLVALDENSNTWTRDKAFIPAGYAVASKHGLCAIYVGLHAGRPVLKTGNATTESDHRVLRATIGKKA